MPDKRVMRREIKWLERVKTWQLLIILVLMLFVSATLLRLNNVGMIQLRDSVLSADTSNDSSATFSALIQLQQYSSLHMNADTGPFYLEGAYKLAVKAAYDKVSNYTDPNGNVNVKADAICKPQFTQYSQAYTDCFAAALRQFPAAPNPGDTIQFPQPALYRFSFSSPRWSPDFAGLSVLACTVIIVIIIGRLITLGTLYLMLKKKYKSV